MSSGCGLEKVPTTIGWIWVVFGSCIANFIVIPIFLFILIRVAYATSAQQNKSHTFQAKAIFISSIGYLISLFMMSLAQFITFYPYHWGINPSQDICSYIKRPEIAFIALSHYFFYEFCLFRINNVFQKSHRLKLYPWQFTTLQILIHCYLIYHGIIFQLLVVLQPHKIFGFCYASEKHSDIHVGIMVLMDAFIVFILIYMFSSKLICGMAEDHSSGSESLSWFKLKTLILGIVATFSSFMVTVLFVLGRMNRFVFVLDGFSNAICIVFTYNMRYVSLPSVSCCNKCAVCHLEDARRQSCSQIQVHQLHENEPLKVVVSSTTKSTTFGNNLSNDIAATEKDTFDMK